MTVKANRAGAVALACEGIRTTGAYCDGSIVVSIPNRDDRGLPLSKTGRVKVARTQAQVKGWSVSKGADACPRAHGMIPLPQQADQ